MASGTVYPAKVNLKALLEGWGWPVSDPTVTWGSPTENEDVALDAIYFGGTEIADDFRVLGAGRSDETYYLTVVVDVRRFGDDEQATEQRAWVLHDNVLTLLRANMTLTGAINRVTGYRVRQGNPVPSPSQWRSQILIEVGCVGLIHY
jgi:hypothetical protein